MKFKRIVGMVLVLSLSFGGVSGCGWKENVNDEHNITSESKKAKVKKPVVVEPELSEIDNTVMRKVTIGELMGYVGYMPAEKVNKLKLTDGGDQIDLNLLEAEALERGTTHYEFSCEYNGYGITGIVRDGFVDYVATWIPKNDVNGECSILFTDYNITIGQSEEVLEKLGDPTEISGKENELIYHWYIYKDSFIDYELLIYTKDGVIIGIEMGRGIYVENPKHEYNLDENAVLTAEQIAYFKLGEINCCLGVTDIDDVSSKFIWERYSGKEGMYDGYSESKCIEIGSEDGVVDRVMVSERNLERTANVMIDDYLDMSVTEYDISVGQSVEVLGKLGIPDERSMLGIEYYYRWFRNDGMYNYTLLIITKYGVIKSIKASVYEMSK